MPSDADLFQPPRELAQECVQQLCEWAKAGGVPVGSTKLVFDATLSSFAVRLSPKGEATFCMAYSFGGKPRRYTIDRFRTVEKGKQATRRGLTAVEARRQAIVLRARIEEREDIAAAKASEKGARKQAEAEKVAADAARLTVGQAFAEYQVHIENSAKKLRPSTVQSIEKSFRLHILPAVGDMQVRDLSREHVKQLHTRAAKRRKMGKGRHTGGEIAANRASDYLSGMLTWLCDNGKLAINVARSNKERFEEEGRERYLSDEEWMRLERTLDEWPRHEHVPVGPRAPGRAVESRELDEPKLAVYLSCEAIRALLLTGSRKGEALGMRWDQLDLEGGVWTKPSSATKQKKSHRLPLNDRMVGKLREIRASHADPVFVFPGRDRLAALQAGRKLPAGAGHLKSVGLWSRMRVRLGLSDVRLHDLRHSHASKLVNSGVDLFTASKALGHATVRTTERYAHLEDGALRSAVNIVGAFSARDWEKKPEPAVPAKRPNRAR